MNQQLIDQSKTEYREKVKLGKEVHDYYERKLKELNIQGFSRITAYLDSFLSEPERLISRKIIFAHLGFEPFASLIAEKKEFAVVSGLNPSSPLHLGHKLMFDILLFLQNLGATVYIPITNDESYLDGKVKSLAESRRIAYEVIIPSIIAFGFDPKKTKIFVLSDYPDIYNFAIDLSKQVTNKYVGTVFGDEALDNSGKAFYRSAVQLAQILLPQLPEFGGIKNTLIPVGIDQHPYILLARDVAKRTGFIQPSEIIFQFQNSLLNPLEKMSGSKPKTAIYLTDTETDIREKINKAYTGSVSVLDVHRELGGVPEACSVFSLLNFHHPDDNFVKEIYEEYKSGKITMSELKKITADFIVSMVKEHQVKVKQVKNTRDYTLKKPLKSFLK